MQDGKEAHSRSNQSQYQYQQLLKPQDGRRVRLALRMEMASKKCLTILILMSHVPPVAWLLSLTLNSFGSCKTEWAILPESCCRQLGKDSRRRAKHSPIEAAVEAIRKCRQRSSIDIRCLTSECRKTGVTTASISSPTLMSMSRCSRRLGR